MSALHLNTPRVKEKFKYFDILNKRKEKSLKHENLDSVLIQPVLGIDWLLAPSPSPAVTLIQL